MDKDKIIKEYYDYISKPEEIWYSHDNYMAKLGITEEEVQAYKDKLSSQLSYKPAEKKEIVIKELIKPMLKECGFTIGGNTWCKKISDNLKLIIHIEGRRFTNSATGAIFEFTISLFNGEGSSKPQLGIGELAIDSRLFLPYYGMLSPLYNTLGYRIDGYRDYLPIDTPIDEIKEYFRIDFEDFILPELMKINNREDYEKMYAKFCREKRFKDPDIRIARFIQRVQLSFTSRRSDGKDYDELIKYKKEMGLTREDILENLELADKMKCHLDFTKIDAKPLLKKLAEDD